MENFCTVDIQINLWKSLLDQFPFTKTEALSIISFRHELGDFEYPPLSEEEKSGKTKLIEFLGISGNTKHVKNSINKM